MSISRESLNRFLNELLTPELFQDYGPNGLQIEGSDTIKKIAFSVSATRESIERAILFEADTLIVHHALFWKFHGIRTITGPFANRIKPLIQNNLNLFGFHLPLDGHPEIGNAAQLANRVGLTKLEPFGEYKRSTTGIKGQLKNPISEQKLKEKIEKVTQHSVTISSVNPDRQINTLGIITGGANDGWLEAFDHNLDAFLTGEMSEHDWHDAKEYGVSMYAAGHHATERFGILALQDRVQNEFPNLETTYIELNNPA
jgi:dinuclear metal center YbgI/SA1388 family protein